MRVKVTERCTGHGRCYALAPDVYEADDEGYNAVIGETIDVPDARVDEARRGAASCPERALEVLDE